MVEAVEGLARTWLGLEAKRKSSQIIYDDICFSFLVLIILWKPVNVYFALYSVVGLTFQREILVVSILFFLYINTSSYL